MTSAWPSNDALLRVLQVQSHIPEQALDLIRHGSDHDFLETMAKLALDPKLTTDIFFCCRDTFPELCHRWMNLGPRFHIVVLAALSRLVRVFPDSVVYIDQLLDRARSSGDIDGSFIAALLSHGNKNPLDLSAGQLHELLLSFLRLSRLPGNNAIKHLSLQRLRLLLEATSNTIRYLTIRLICSKLNASDASVQKFLSRTFPATFVTGLWEGKEIDYFFLPLWERKRDRDLRKQLTAAQQPFEGMQARSVDKNDLSAQTVDIHGLYLRGSEKPENQASSLVETASTRFNMQQLATAISANSPILLTGQSGAGKTSLVLALAKRLGSRDDLVVLHLNDQTDAKSLIGLYTTSNDSRSFKWVPGVLANAIENGHWVLIEDVDKTSAEALDLLSSIIRRGELSIPTQGRTISFSPNFKIIATASSIDGSASMTKLAALRVLDFDKWYKVDLARPSHIEYFEIVEARFPTLRSLKEPIMSCFTSVSEHHHATARSAPQEQTYLRELLRWCKRVFSLSNSDHNLKSDQLRDEIFLEAVNCFTNQLEMSKEKQDLVAKIAESLRVPPNRVQLLLHNRPIDYTDTETSLKVGRLNIARREAQASLIASQSQISFSRNKFTLRYLEQVGLAVKNKEATLLIGETGSGKTTLIQSLSDILNQKLVVMNMSYQSEVGDILGGLRPTNIKSLVNSINVTFKDLLVQTFVPKKSRRFAEESSSHVIKQSWNNALRIWTKGYVEAMKQIKSGQSSSVPNLNGTEIEVSQPSKRRRLDLSSSTGLQKGWRSFAVELEKLAALVEQGPAGRGFAFMESEFVKAVRNGHWVLLDEINLAPTEITESITDLIQIDQNDAPSLLLTEKDGESRVTAHPNFRLFGAMNPANDVGKKDLPQAIRSRFTEIYVASPDSDSESLLQLVEDYLGSMAKKYKTISRRIVDLYFSIKQLSLSNGIVDSTGHRPHFSLRTLTRALQYTSALAASMSTERALFEAFVVSFTATLDETSNATVSSMLREKLFTASKGPKRPTEIDALLKRELKKPANSLQFVNFQGYWVKRGQFEIRPQDSYVITPFIKKNLLNLVRAMSLPKFPILIQGPTSSGKTSMVRYLANLSGNKFVRINNHEHTDLQEYLGTYASDEEGRLIYRDGVLVQALKQGHWIVLDELNLAPTDVLEALNRLLDDNRELFVPETQSIISPHPDFMLFATQNPAGAYGGRKTLSRALRNRFIEMHFDEIPQNELEIILQQSQTPIINPRYCSLIASVYRELSIARQSDRVFEERNSFATLRDLFRWAKRPADNYEQLGINGYMLLAERVRSSADKALVKSILEAQFSQKSPGFSIDEALLYANIFDANLKQYESLKSSNGLVMTNSMKRLIALVHQALQNDEPVLLVGETGSGKTSVCQTLADAKGQILHIVNAHQNLEAGDVIGSQRPIRNRSDIRIKLEAMVKDALNGIMESVSIDSFELDGLLKVFDKHGEIQDSQTHADITMHRKRLLSLFEWVDGSLVSAMKAGEPFLLDEISLAEDSVLERLNSVLEPERQIVLAEKGSGDLIQARHGFQLMATMNPGGDYGKKELSPALRNRFTEIWVPAIFEREELLDIVTSKIQESNAKRRFSAPVVDFTIWYNNRYYPTRKSISLRDIKSWVGFLNSSSNPQSYEAFVQGAALVYIDTIGANPAALSEVTFESISLERTACLQQLSILVDREVSMMYSPPINITYSTEMLSIGSYSLHRSDAASNPDINLDIPTTRLNAMRILRALQVQKPVLIEGDPGVGKTALVTALAQAVGKPLTRINLSEQTDLMDLFGSDVPLPDSGPGVFAWQTAAFLQALQDGHWILLDEINLASQSVLEGLNACFDYRRSVYIAELDQTFSCHPDFVIFAAQNPHHQGGGRKGLPASFVNRFTVVYADRLSQEDMLLISQSAYPTIEEGMLRQIINVVEQLDRKVGYEKSLGLIGSPWEFNLRDILRWLSLIGSDDKFLLNSKPEEFVDLLFAQRFRAPEDWLAVRSLSKKAFETYVSPDVHLQILGKDFYQVGKGYLPRSETIQPVSISKHDVSRFPLKLIESVMICIQQRWPCILVGRRKIHIGSVVEHLATIAGAELAEITLTPETDTADLIGGYEQKSIRRKLSRLLLNIQGLIERHICFDTIDSLDSRLSLVLDQIQECHVEYAPAELQKLNSLLNPVDIDNLNKYRKQLSSMIAEGTSLDSVSFSFEWVDGPLIEAVQDGQWLILRNANCCNPSVLDRLNSLLEPNGALIMNEQRTNDGSPRVIWPHPNFRVFLVSDPIDGELSRAMRNRGVELFVEVKGGNESHGCPNNNLEDSEYQDSWLMPFETLARRAQEVGTNDLTNPELDTAIMTLGIDSLQKLSEWAKQVRSGLADIPITEDSFLVKRVMAVPSFLESTAANTSLDFYKSLEEKFDLPTTYAGSRPVNPLAKFPAQSLRSHCSHDFLRTCTLVLDRFLALTVVTSDLQAAATTDLAVSRQSNMRKDLMNTLLEHLKSVSSVFDISMKARYALPISFANLIDKILILCSISSQLMLNAALERQIQWQSIFEYLGTLIRKAATENSLITDFLSSVSSALALFAGKWQRKSGLSMVPLWKTFRPQIGSTHESFEMTRKLEDIADRLDNALWQQEDRPSNQSLSLRNKFLRLRKTILTSPRPSEDLVDELETTLKEIEGGLPVGETIPVPYFKEVFQSMLRRRDISGTYTGSEERFELAVWDQATFYSRRPLRDEIAFWPSENKAHNVLLGLRNFQVVEAGSSHDEKQSSQSAERIVQACCNISQSKIAQIESLGNELQVLSTVIVHQAEWIPQDELDLLFQQTLKLAGNIISAHLDERSTNLVPLDDAGQIFNALSILTSQELSPSLQHIFQTLLAPAIRILRGAETIADGIRSKARNLSQALILTTITFLMLFVPEDAYDPALTDALEKHVNESLLSDLSLKLKSLKFNRKDTSDEDDSLHVSMIKEQVILANSESPRGLVHRSSSSRLEESRPELLSTLRLITTLLTESGDLVDLTIERIDLLRQSLAAIQTRLSPYINDLVDVLSPLQASMQSLDLGLQLCIISNSGPEELPLQETVDCFVPFYGSIAVNFAEPTVNSERLSLLGFIKSHGDQQGSDAYQEDSSLLSDLISQSFRLRYLQWKTILSQDREKLASETSTYRYKDQREDESEDEDYEIEQLFPSFSDGSTQSKKGASQVSAQESLAVDTSYAHAKIFLTSEKQNTDIIGFIQEYLPSAAAKYNNRKYLSLAESSSKQLPTTILALDAAAQYLQDQAVDSSAVYFYKSPSLKNTKRFGKILQNIVQRFRELHQAWPEHVTIQEVLRLSRDILELSISEPIAKLVVQAELIHERINEWQQVASSEFSAALQYEMLNGLIIDWRRLELMTWPHLLQSEMLEFKNAARSWWFIVYEAAIEVPTSLNEESEQSLSSYSEELVSTLMPFIVKSTAGQFAERLQLLIQIQRHLMTEVKLHPHLGPVLSSITNCLTYAKLFEGRIQERIDQAQTKLQREIKEVILLASWKDNNIIALKQSSQRSHRKLLRIIKRFRKALREPVESIFEVAPPADQTSIANEQLYWSSEISSFPDKTWPISQMQESISLGKRPFWLDNPQKTAKQVADLIPSAQNTNDLRMKLDDLLASIQEPAEALRKSTPEYLTEDNQSICKQLKVQKHNLFAQALSGLRQIGIACLQTSTSIRSQNSLAKILSSSHPASLSRIGDLPLTDEQHFLRFAHNASRTASLARRRNPDLGSKEYTRGLGYLEGLCSIILSQRSHLMSFSQTRFKLQRTVKLLINLVESSEQPRNSVRWATPTALDDLHLVRKQTLWAPNVLQACLSLVKKQSAISKNFHPELEKGLDGFVEKFQSLNKDWISVPEMPRCVTSSSTSAILDCSQKALKELRDNISTWSGTYPEFHPHFQHLIEWLERKDDAFDDWALVEKTTIVSLDKLRETVFDACGSILKNVQQFSDEKLLPNQQSDQPSFRSHNTGRRIKLMRADVIGQKLQKILDTFDNIDTDEVKSPLMHCSLVALILPVLTAYLDSYTELLQGYFKLYKSTCRSASWLSNIFCELLTNGFCSPKEKPPNGESNNEKVEDGVGLGEGEGTEDISNEIGDDEDLTELSKEPKLGHGKEDLKQEDGAVDIDDELEGASDDEANESTNGEGADEDSLEDEDDNLDEEVGNSDDIDASAVDEKIWNSKDALDKEQNASENKDAKSSAEDQAAGAKEERQGTQPQSPGAEQDAILEETETVEDEIQNGEASTDMKDDTEQHVPEAETLELPDDLEMGEQAHDDDISSLGGSDLPEDQSQIRSDADSIRSDGDRMSLDEETGHQDQADDEDARLTEEQLQDQLNTEQERIDRSDHQQSLDDGGDQFHEQNDNNDGYSAEPNFSHETKQAGQDQNQDSEEKELDSVTKTNNENNQSEQARTSNPNGEPSIEDETKSDSKAEAQSSAESASRDNDKFKKLGDALDKWYRYESEIKEANSDQLKESREPNESIAQGADFEHVLNQETDHDAQASGAAAGADPMVLDDKKAIDMGNDSEEMDPLPEMEIDNSSSDSEDERANASLPEVFLNQDKSSSEAAKKPTVSSEEGQDMEEDALQIVDDVDHQLSAVNISERPTEEFVQSSRLLWAECESKTSGLAHILTEQLRLILTPTQATKMRGDFRTGKRLNIKRIIPYIASDYKKDKIWMRRTVPSKRNYQIMLAIDDSKSMMESNCGRTALETLALVGRSLDMLDAGQISVVGFGKNVKIAHEFGTPFTRIAGSQAFEHFKFDQSETDIRKLIEFSLGSFRQARQKFGSSSSQLELLQLQLIVSDGICPKHDSIRRLIRQAQEERIVILFVVIDNHKQGSKESILKLPEARFEEENGESVVRMGRYMDSFPFQYYLVVHNVKELPAVLSQALRSWFTEVVD